MMPFDPKHRRKRSTAPTALQSQKVKQSATVSPQAEVQKTLSQSNTSWKCHKSQGCLSKFVSCLSVRFTMFSLHLPAERPPRRRSRRPGWQELLESGRSGGRERRMGQAEHITPKALRGLDGSRLLNNVVMFQGRAAVYLQHFHRTCVRLEVALYSWVGSC